MKDKFNSFIIFLVIAAMPLLSLAGCSDDQSQIQNSNQTYSENSTNNLSSKGNSKINTIKTANITFDDTASRIPKGEPTFVIDSDGKVVLTSDMFTEIGSFADRAK